MTPSKALALYAKACQSHRRADWRLACHALAQCLQAGEAPATAPTPEPEPMPAPVDLAAVRKAVRKELRAVDQQLRQFATAYWYPDQDVHPYRDAYGAVKWPDTTSDKIEATTMEEAEARVLEIANGRGITRNKRPGGGHGWVIWAGPELDLDAPQMLVAAE